MSILRIRDENGKFVAVTTVKGDKGDTPIKGTDYFTNSDIVAIKKDLVNTMYPVGAVIITMTSTNPGDTAIGGTWEQISQGRFLIGVGSPKENTETAFGDLNNNGYAFHSGGMGGQYTHQLTVDEIPSHKHNMGVHHGNSGSGVNSIQGSAGDYNWAGTEPLIGFPEATGGDQPHNNMPPYFGVYMWQRTA